MGVEQIQTGGRYLGQNFSKIVSKSCFLSSLLSYTYAVKDQVNLSHLSDLPRNDVIDVTKLLPIEQHDFQIKEFSILILSDCEAHASIC
jgi:hypothetical protein